MPHLTKAEAVALVKPGVKYRYDYREYEVVKIDAFDPEFTISCQLSGIARGEEMCGLTEFVGLAIADGLARRETDDGIVIDVATSGG